MSPVAVDIPNRPFSTEPFMGMMLPDGFFEAAIGHQRLNAQFRHVGGNALATTNVYVEGTSHPGLVVTPATHSLTGLDGGGVRLVSWDIDVSNAPPGIHRVSFVADDGTDRTRLIKKIFVTRTEYDPATEEFTIVAPEGRLSVLLRSGLGPASAPDCKPSSEPNPDLKLRNLIDDLRRLEQELPEGAQTCFPFYLLTEFDLACTHTAPFPGQYSDLPYDDPWWKTLLLVLCIILLIAAIVLIFVAGIVAVAFTGGAAGPAVVVTFNCCVAPPAIALAGVLIGAAASGTAAGLLDVRDPFRRGQDNTIPAEGELTVAERVTVKLDYIEPVALGRPYKVHAQWEYTRVTDSGQTYGFAVDEVNENVHVLSRYEVDAPDIVRLADSHDEKKENWVVEARFFDKDSNLLSGGDLLVQCVLEGTDAQAGRFHKFFLQDDGLDPDRVPADGTYTGSFRFSADDIGRWAVYVIAQDVNTADPSLAPEDAAKIIGGQIVTHQLTIDYSGGSCPLIPDGQVEVA